MALSRPVTVRDASSRCPTDVCVAAVLGDKLRRVAVLGGREGLPRSLGSVYGGAVARFLGGALRGVVSRVVHTPGAFSQSNGVAVSRDGAMLLVADTYEDGEGSDAIHVFSFEHGSAARVIGGYYGTGPLQFKAPCQIWVAADGFVFVADSLNRRVQVLSPELNFHGFVGEGKLTRAAGVCANADVVVVSDSEDHRLSVFRRHDGALLTRIGALGRGDGQLLYPHGVCFMSGDRHVAVTDSYNDRVSVFSLGGNFIRHVGVGVLEHFPQGVVCSAFDELVVTDGDDKGVSRWLHLFSDVGDLLMTFGRGTGSFTGVALHGSTLVAADCDEATCTVFS